MMRDQADRLRSLVEKMRQKASEPSTPLIERGQELVVIVADGIHRGAYSCKVVSGNAVTCLISMPRVEGRQVLLTTGTKVRLQIDDVSLEGAVLERRFSPEPTLVISIGSGASESLVTRKERHVRIISISSGKGGVGKTNLTVNLALAAKRAGYRPMIFDADLGLANVDIVLGIYPKYNLTHVLRGERSMREIVTSGPEDVPIVAGGSGVTELVNLPEWQLSRFVDGLSELEGLTDLILIDTGAGLSNSVLSFLMAASEVIIVTTPEPTSITDAYAVVKLLSQRKDCHVRVLVNRAQSAHEAQTTFDKMSQAAKRFLSFSVSFLGWLPDDPVVTASIKRQRPFLLEYPNSQVSVALNKVATILFDQANNDPPTHGLRAFFTRLTKFLGQ